MNSTNLTLAAVAALAGVGAVVGRGRQGDRNTDKSPRWLMNVGFDSLNYGGGWITIHPDGSLDLSIVRGIDAYPSDFIQQVLAQAGYVDSDPDDADLADTIWPHTVYRTSIEDDVLADCDWVEPQDLVEFYGGPEFDLDTLKEWSISPDPRLRANVLEEIGRYHGFHELDPEPDVITGTQLHRLFPGLENGESFIEPGRRSLRGPRGGISLLPKNSGYMSKKDWATWDRRRKALRQRRGLTWSQVLPLIGSRR